MKKKILNVKTPDRFQLPVHLCFQPINKVIKPIQHKIPTNPYIKKKKRHEGIAFSVSDNMFHRSDRLSLSDKRQGL